MYGLLPKQNVLHFHTKLIKILLEHSLESRSKVESAQQIPGPGCLIDEDSDYYYTSDSESSLGPDDHPETLAASMPPKQSTEPVPEEQEPLPKQFFRHRPWQDPYVTRASDNSVRYQPDTSNAAMYEFMRRARDSETASRAATWGTSRRRLSDSDMESLHMSEI